MDNSPDSHLAGKCFTTDEMRNKQYLDLRANPGELCIIRFLVVVVVFSDILYW